jgi:hypothetical protein
MRVATLTVGEGGGNVGILEVKDMVQLQQDRPGEVVICVSEPLDSRAAAGLARCLGEVPAKTHVVVDFTRVRSFHGVGMAAVALKLAGVSDLELRGLGLHHRRLLRYCGVGAAEPRAGVAED